MGDWLYTSYVIYPEGLITPELKEKLARVLSDHGSFERLEDELRMFDYARGLTADEETTTHRIVSFPLKQAMLDELLRLAAVHGPLPVVYVVTDRDEHPVAANIDIPVTRMNEALLLSALQLSIIEERIL